MIEELVTTWGYPIIFFGTVLEGETPLAMGGFAAHRGYLSLWIVLAVGFAGSVAGDQLWFYLGRRHGERVLARRPSWRRSIERVSSLLDAHPVLFVVGFRFLYGLRTVSPFAIGMTKFPRRRFVVLNLIGAAVWTVIFGGAGYLFGSALETWLGKVKRFEGEVFVLLAVLGLVVWVVHVLRSRHQA